MTSHPSLKDHVIVGTAGHIDHGKTALVKALTGIDADTLSEEKRRGITIELGFVFLDAPESPKQVVFIDVPGHEKLVKTMVAGASNIDAALLVIAADEGINVQTQEHFDVLQILGVKQGIVALTKKDLVDETRIADLKSEVREFVQGTFLSQAPFIPVSAITGWGIDELKSALLELAGQVEDRYDSGIFRMPVDRVFTMSGFGTVIAGTVLSGEVRVEDKIEVYPEKLLSRVRGIHVHHKQAERAKIGQRTAVNLPDIKKENLRRGQCAAHPGSLFPTSRLDGKLHLLKSFEKGLKNRTRIRLHIGTAEIICRLALLDRDKLLPGDSAVVQLLLESPIVALPRDRFVIRTFSPLLTIGGGYILDAQPGKHKRYDKETLAGLEKLNGDESSVVEQIFLQSGFFSQRASDVTSRIGQNQAMTESLIQALSEQGSLVRITASDKASPKEAKYIHKKSYADLKKRLVFGLEGFFNRHPYQLLMPLGELRSQFRELVDSLTFDYAVQDLLREKHIYLKDTKVGLCGYEVKMIPREMELALKVEEKFKKAGVNSPLEEEVREALGVSKELFQNIMRSMLEQGKLVRLDEKVSYHRDTLKSVRDFVVEYIRRNQSISLAELRDSLKFSRKYAQAILEYFDSVALTKRVEDKRILQ